MFVDLSLLSWLKRPVVYLLCVSVHVYFGKKNNKKKQVDYYSPWSHEFSKGQGLWNCKWNFYFYSCLWEALLNVQQLRVAFWGGEKEDTKDFISILPKIYFLNLPITFIHSSKILEIKYLLNVWRILCYVGLLNSILWRESLLGQHIKYSHFTHSHKKKLDYQVKITMTRIIC